MYAYTPRPLPLALVAFFFLCTLVLPAVRLRLHAGVRAIVAHRAVDAVHRAVAVAIGALGLGAVGWALAYIAVGPESLDAWPTPLPLRTLALVALGLSLGLLCVAQRQMGRSWRVGIDPEAATDLVTSGLYGVVRHPIYCALALAVAGLALLTPASWTVMGATQALVLIAIQARLEEEHLARVHGAAYRAYASRVGRFIPGLGRLTEGSR
jgi:protein-S-isoprenylcysteine O-methyltransferase Ste14